MVADLRIPKFEDGEFLSEADLYPLAGLSLAAFALGAGARGLGGFVRPFGGEETAWNDFRLGEGRLVLERLCLISEAGLPFVSLEPHAFELSTVTLDSTDLYATLYRAVSARAFKEPAFAGGPENHADAEARRINGYRVLLHWGDSAPEVAGAASDTILLGRLTDDGFEPAPPVYVPAALPALAAAVEAVANCVDGLTRVLWDPDVAPRLERRTLLERLERLALALSDADAPTRGLVFEARLVAKAAKWFLLRVAYVIERHDPRFRGFEALSVPLLEQRLAALDGVGRGLLAEAIQGFDALASTPPTTGHEQVTWFGSLATLLGPERNAQLLQALTTAKAPRSPETPRQPVRSRIIRIDEQE
jgi:hypothetical protein